MLKFDSRNLQSRRIDPKQHTGQTVLWTEQDGLQSEVRVGDKVCKYGQEFVWTEKHWLPEQLEPLRQEGDPDADNILEILDASPNTDAVDLLLLRRMQREEKADHSRVGAAPSSESPKISKTDAAQDVIANEKELLGGRNTQQEELLDDFLLKYCSVPSWVDEEKVRRGQEVFVQYLPAAGLSLFFASLVGGFSAPKIAKVLRATGYLIQGREKVFRRLNDTGAMIFDCLAPGALSPARQGWESVLRVRFLHASVRRRLRKARYWDAEAWGDPINQEDMSVTLLAFSYNVLVGCELVHGTPLTAEEREAYLHLWRYIGWLIGVREGEREGGRERAFCAGEAEAKAGMESMVVHLLSPDPDSTAVAHHLLSVLDPTKFGVRCALCRAFLGPALADALSLPPLRAHPFQSVLALVTLASLRFYAWCGRSMGVVQRWQMRLHLRLLAATHPAPNHTPPPPSSPKQQQQQQQQHHHQQQQQEEEERIMSNDTRSAARSTRSVSKKETGAGTLVQKKSSEGVCSAMCLCASTARIARCSCPTPRLNIVLVPPSSSPRPHVIIPDVIVPAEQGLDLNAL